MVTGDNVRTAISVARECGLVSHSANVYIPSFVQGRFNQPPSRSINDSGTGTKENAQLDWVSVDDEALRLDEYSLKPIVPAHLVMTLDGGENDFSDYQLAVTGDVFRWMLEYAALETVQRVRSSPT
jgi:cation-transporting ATPase 13A2